MNESTPRSPREPWVPVREQAARSEASLRCTATIGEFSIFPDDHGHWIAALKLNVVSPESLLIDYARHTGVDVKSTPDGYKQFLNAYFEPLGPLGLTDVPELVRQFSNLMRRIDSGQYPYYWSPTFSRHNSKVTEMLRGKEATIEVTPWPLRSTESYNVVFPTPENRQYLTLGPTGTP